MNWLDEVGKANRAECDKYTPPKWTKDWPTTPGYYWYYGWFEGLDIDDDGLHFMFVSRHAGNMHIMAGTMIAYCESREVLQGREMTPGRWMKALTPELPGDDE